MSPIVSVIVPVYNSYSYLRSSIGSILNQDLEDIELILINDGSTDESMEVIEEFISCDSRVTCVSQKHSGAGVARNIGISLAKGKYLSFLDSDDIFDSEMLLQMLSVCELYGLDILITPFREIGGFLDVKLGLKAPSIDAEVFNCYSIPSELFQITSPNAWTKMFRKDFILKYGIRFQEIKTCNDFFFTYSAMTVAEKISILNDSFVSYRRDAVGSISSWRGDNFKNIFYAGYELKGFLISNNMYCLLKDSFRRRMIACFNYESRFVSSHNVEEFKADVEVFLSNL